MPTDDSVKSETLDEEQQNIEVEGVPAPAAEDSGTYSREDFTTLSLEALEKLTGLTPPAEENKATAYREKAWQSYKLDLANKAEWGTARQNGDDLPEGV